MTSKKRNMVRKKKQHKKIKDLETRTLLTNRYELECSDRVGNSCSIITFISVYIYVKYCNLHKFPYCFPTMAEQCNMPNPMTKPYRAR